MSTDFTKVNCTHRHGTQFTSTHTAHITHTHTRKTGKLCQMKTSQVELSSYLICHSKTLKDEL